MTSTLAFMPVMCAGPDTEPQRRSDEETELIIKLAKGAVAVVGTEKSTTHPVSFCRMHGVWELRAEEGKRMWVFD